MAPVPITDNYYAILEIPHTAALEVVRQSYRRLAKALHPDKNPDKLGATASFQSVCRSPSPL
jgi:molecular chaperone DnaJ